MFRNPAYTIASSAVTGFGLSSYLFVWLSGGPSVDCVELFLSTVMGAIFVAMTASGMAAKKA